MDAGGAVESPPGEANRLCYRARGSAAVIPPWNFPLAIPTGIVDAVSDELLYRLVGATPSLRVGHPRHMGTQVGPLIDADAHKRVRSYLELAEHEGTVVFHQDDVPATGFFVGPTIVTDVSPRSR